MIDLSKYKFFWNLINQQLERTIFDIYGFIENIMIYNLKFNILVAITFTERINYFLLRLTNLFNCSKIRNVNIVCGPSLKKYGVNPFHKLKNPSFCTVFIRQSIVPLYSLFFIDCNLVLVMSIGIETTVEKKPLIKLAAKCKYTSSYKYMC